MLLPCFCERGKTVAALLYSSLIIVKSPQICGHRQIAEPRNYCLVRVIVFFFGVCFSLFFCFSQVRNSGLIPYNWCQSLGLGLSGSNGRGSKKGV